MAARRALAAGMLLLVAAVLFAYRAAPDNGFHFDDHPNITGHPATRVDTPSFEGFLTAALDGANPTRILTNLSFALDWWRGGGEPRPFQYTNLAVHLLGTLLVLGLLRTLLGRAYGPAAAGGGALLGAALWALHPIQVQAVTYIVQRSTGLAALFTVLAVLAYVHGRTSPHRRAWFGLCAAAVCLGAISKENAWIAPALLLLAELALVRGRLTERSVHRAILALPAVIVAWVALDLASGAGPLYGFVAPLYEARDFSLGERLLTQPRVLAFHLSQILWPLPGRFSLEHDLAVSTGLFNPPATAFALLGLAAWIAAGLAALWRPGTRLGGFFVLWVPLTLAIESSFVPLEMVFEHRLYLPSVGLAGLAALGLARAWDAGPPVRAAAGAAGLAAAVALALATAERVPHWRTDLSLFAQAVRTAPASPRARFNLGNALLEAGRPAEAAAQYRTALGLEPAAADLLINLALAERRLGREGVAVELLERAVAVARAAPDPGPDGAPPTAVLEQALYNLGNALADLGRLEAAAARYREVLDLNPAVPAVHNNLADALRRLGDAAGAAAHYRQAVALDPDHLPARLGLALAEAQRGDRAAAFAALDAALKRAPADPRPHRLRAALHLEAGEAALAEAAARRGLEAAGAQADLHTLLGRALAAQGRLGEAEPHFRSAAALAPGDPDVHSNLGALLLQRGAPAAEARRHLERALALAPDHRLARRNLEALERAAGAP